MDNMDSPDQEPREIAIQLFSEDPKPPFSCQLLAYADPNDAPFLFEIMLTILLEGVDIMVDGLTTTDLTKFTENHVLTLNPWLNSIGFQVNIENSGKQILDHYCKIILRNSPAAGEYFKNVHEDTSYHFVINYRAYEKNKVKTKIDELYALFHVNGKLYKIWFTAAKLTNTPRCG